LQGLLESTKKSWVATHFFEIIGFESSKNADISIFPKKEGKDSTSQICIEFGFKYRKAIMFIKILNLHVFSFVFARTTPSAGTCLQLDFNIIIDR